MTLRWPYHDLGITPLWNSTPTNVTMCTWLGFRPIYFYTTLRVKGTILRWPLVTLPMHIKSADHLEVTWYIVMFQKMWSTQIPRGRGYSWAHARYNSLTLMFSTYVMGVRVYGFFFFTYRSVSAISKVQSFSKQNIRPKSLCNASKKTL